MCGTCQAWRALACAYPDSYRISLLECRPALASSNYIRLGVTKPLCWAHRTDEAVVSVYRTPTSLLVIVQLKTKRWFPPAFSLLWASVSRPEPYRQCGETLSCFYSPSYLSPYLTSTAPVAYFTTHKFTRKGRRMTKYRLLGVKFLSGCCRYRVGMLYQISLRPGESWRGLCKK